MGYIYFYFCVFGHHGPHGPYGTLGPLGPYGPYGALGPFFIEFSRPRDPSKKNRAEILCKGASKMSEMVGWRPDLCPKMFLGFLLGQVGDQFGMGLGCRQDFRLGTRSPFFSKHLC